MGVRRWVLSAAQALDESRLRRASARVPEHFRIEAYGGHGAGGGGVVVRGRVVDDPPLSRAVEGEGPGTGVQRASRMVLQTLAGSAITRVPFPGAAELYRDLADGSRNPVFYISSRPWNLHAFITDFLDHRGCPAGPALLRDLLGTAEGREDKRDRICEVLDLHPELRFVLIGDSGEADPHIYADIVRGYPSRILAVYIRRFASILETAGWRGSRTRGPTRRLSSSRPTPTPYGVTPSGWA